MGQDVRRPVARPRARAPVAQWIEQPPPKRKVASSTLAWGTSTTRRAADSPERERPASSTLAWGTSKKESSRLPRTRKARQFDSGLGHQQEREQPSPGTGTRSVPCH